MMNDEEIEYITDLLFNENWKEQKDLILFTKDLKTANRRLAEQVNQLQSNWNSLREWLEKQKHDTEICKEWNRKNNFNDIDYERDIKRFDFILDKMNELEGEDNVRIMGKKETN